jgi:hypothetical protein
VVIEVARPVVGTLCGFATLALIAADTMGVPVAVGEGHSIPGIPGDKALVYFVSFSAGLAGNIVLGILNPKR